jgi:hypothetical protein
MEGWTVERTGYGYAVHCGDAGVRYGPALDQVTDAGEVTAVVTMNLNRRLWCHRCVKAWCEHTQAVVDQDEEGL